MGNRRGLVLHLIVISIYFVTTAYTCLGVQNSSVVCSEQERLALLKFKHSIKDDIGLLLSWVGNDCCRWERIHCDAVTGHVDGLHLRSDYPLYEDLNLVGNEVSSSLAELSHLKYLDLSGNYFGGSRIPEFIGSLKQLRYLNLSYAGFRGTVPPHIGNLSNLKVLDLSSDWNFGSLDLTSHGLMTDNMAWIFGLSSLEHLDLSCNDLSGAQNWDILLYMIPSLKELSLSFCNLSNANIRPFLNSSKMLPNFKYLDLSYNVFEGPLPHFLPNMSSLEFLDLSNFNISLAWNFVQLLNMIPSLSKLHLSSCRLNKMFLSSYHLNFSTLSNIQHLDLSSNSVRGIFPSILTNMSSLRVLDFSDNMLISTVPVMPSLLELDLSSNKFQEIEHVGIWRRCHLKKLSASFNPFGIDMTEPPKNISECSQYALERLDLHGSLYGTIPEPLGRLANLRSIDLSMSKLKGPIPEFLGRLRFLEVLDLSFNQLNGSIPESLGKLANLTHLNLESNRLTGPIPASLGRLSLLEGIWVRSNFLNGTIPVSIGQLAKLRFVDFSNNALEGLVFEDHFANLSWLKELDTSSNTKLILKFSNKWVPPFQLVELQLMSCNIGNRFPRWLQTQRKLEVLDLSNTTISGPLPTWLQEMNIPRLDLSHNKLSGPLTNLPHGGDGLRQRIFLKNNLFSGSIPSSLCTRTRLIYLDFSENRLTGNIPNCLGDLDLEAMMLSSNQLSGVFPCSVGYESLIWLKLNDNNFTGEFPQEPGKLLDLDVLDLGNNNFFGSIPEWIGENLTYLRVLRLHRNNFTGRIPESLCKAPRLQILDVAYNNLKGTIPRCLGELKAIVGSNPSYPNYDGPPNTYRFPARDFEDNVIQSIKGVDLEYETWRLVYNIDLSSNKLVGEIPVELSALTLLVSLNLSNNHISGGIPNNIGNLTQLFSLDLSRNELTGMIPSSVAALNFLTHFNLSHNNLSGQIPTGRQLQTLIDPSIYAGNKDLCGSPLSKNCSNPEDQTRTPEKKYKAGDEPRKVWLLFGLDIMCGFATGFWGIIGVLVFKNQWRMKLFKFVEETMNKKHVAVLLKVAKIKRHREAV